MSPMYSIISNNRSRTSHSMVAIGAIIVAAASICMIQSRRRKQQQQQQQQDDVTDDSATDDGESDFYKQLGITEKNLPTHVQREIHKERKRKAKMEIISMKKPMYDNVFMLDTNREQVCTISMRKARWYIKKGIAEWTAFKNDDDDDVNVGTKNNSNHPKKEEAEAAKCIRLLFEHRGSKSKEVTPGTLYLRSAKKNICVSCGGGGHHIRHYIIPFSYRTLLPEEYKLHMSHDVVILCSDCHLEIDRQTKIRMKNMEAELRSKMGGKAASSVSPFVEDQQLSHIRSWAIALVRSREKMPTEKVERYEKTIRNYLASVCNHEEEKEALLNGKDELTKSQLQTACSVSYRVTNPNYVAGADLIVKSLKDTDSIEAFIIDWRKHFIDTAIPQHMPEGWRVDNPVVHGSWTDADRAGVKSE